MAQPDHVLPQPANETNHQQEAVAHKEMCVSGFDVYKHEVHMFRVFSPPSVHYNSSNAILEHLSEIPYRDSGESGHSLNAEYLFGSS